MQSLGIRKSENNAIDWSVASEGYLRKNGAGLGGLHDAGQKTSDLKTTGLQTGTAIERMMALTRADIAYLDADRILAPDLAKAAAMVASGAVTTAAGHGLLPGLGATPA